MLAIYNLQVLCELSMVKYVQKQTNGYKLSWDAGVKLVFNVEFFHIGTLEKLLALVWHLIWGHGALDFAKFGTILGVTATPTKSNCKEANNNIWWYWLTKHIVGMASIIGPKSTKYTITEKKSFNEYAVRWLEL